MALLLTILQPGTLVVLQHAMLPAEMTLAETAIPDDALRAFFAGVEGAFYFLGRHATTDGEGHVQSCRRGNEGGECGGGR
jgi:hypothetical protein